MVGEDAQVNFPGPEIRLLSMLCVDIGYTKHKYKDL